MTENNNHKLNGGNCSSCLHYFEGNLDQSVKTNTMNINCDYFMEIKKKKNVNIDLTERLL